ncbi:MAG: sugar transferase [Microthrixaceae bacterium]|nr:sugar transferase [Microthrixaceae bacterium]
MKAGSGLGAAANPAAHATQSTMPSVRLESGLSTDHPYRGKRAMDLAMLALAVVPAFLVGLVCALAVRLTSRGPVFFRQERIGLDGKPFMVWKFRTMTNGNNPIFPDQCEITTVGAVLRRFSLDELPQLINVATGEMSIVGPRPTLRYQVERYNSHQWRRLAVKPGLTGLAQVSGRNSLMWDERIRFDIEYVESQSPLEDIRLSVKTVTTIITGNGVEGHQADDPLASAEVEIVDLTALEATGSPHHRVQSTATHIVGEPVSS